MPWCCFPQISFKILHGFCVKISKLKVFCVVVFFYIKALRKIVKKANFNILCPFLWERFLSLYYYIYYIIAPLYLCNNMGGLPSTLNLLSLCFMWHWRIFETPNLFALCLFTFVNSLTQLQVIHIFIVLFIFSFDSHSTIWQVSM